MNQLVTTNSQQLVAPTRVEDLREADRAIVKQWLYGKSPYTQRNYHSAVDPLLAIGPMKTVTLREMQEHVESVSERTRPIVVAAIKSLWKFTSQTAPGYLAFNPSIALKTPKQRDVMTDRITSRDNIVRMLDRTENKRDHAFIRLLYHSGIRVGEATELRWSDFREYDDYVAMDVFGKGRKLRHVKISYDVYCELVEQSESAEFVFSSQMGGNLKRRQAERILHEAGVRIGLNNVVPHMMRHSNASHALADHAPIEVVQASLGHASLLTTQRYIHIQPGVGSSDYIHI